MNIHSPHRQHNIHKINPSRSWPFNLFIWSCSADKLFLLFRLFANWRQSVWYCIICYRPHILHQHHTLHTHIPMKSVSMLLQIMLSIYSIEMDLFCLFVPFICGRHAIPRRTEHLFSGRFHFCGPTTLAWLPKRMCFLRCANWCIRSNR